MDDEKKPSTPDTLTGQPAETKTPERPTADGEVLPAPVASVLRQAGVDPQDPKQILSLIQMQMTMFRGPLPMVPPDLLEQYKQVDPKLVDKFAAWTETQANHRRTLELMAANRAEMRMDRGQIMGFGVTLVGLAASVIAAINGGWAGAAVGGIIAMVSVGGVTVATIMAQRWDGWPFSKKPDQAPPPPKPEAPKPKPDSSEPEKK